MQHALELAWGTCLKMADGFFALLPNLLIGLVVLSLFLAGGNLSKRIVSKIAQKAHLDVTLARALGTCCSVFIDIFGLLVTGVIVIPQFSMAHVIGGLGISSVAIGFAFKDILQNFFAGMLLLWQKPFHIGDQIKTKDYEGTVEDITIRSTELRTFTGELVLVPNGDIFTNAIIVNTAYGKRRVSLNVAAKDARDVDDVRATIRDAVQKTEGVQKDPAPAVHLFDLTGDALNFEVVFWSGPRNEDMINTKDRVASAIRRALATKSADSEIKSPQSQSEGPDKKSDDAVSKPPTSASKPADATSKPADSADKPEDPANKAADSSSKSPDSVNKTTDKLPKAS